MSEGDSIIFLLISVGLGGGCAWLAARAVALTWRPWWHLVLFMLILGGAVRFLQYALFGRELFNPSFYTVDTLVLMAIALLGYRATRRQQMARQYGFLVRTTRRPQP